MLVKNWQKSVSRIDQRTTFNDHLNLALFRFNVHLSKIDYNVILALELAPAAGESEIETCHEIIICPSTVLHAGTRNSWNRYSSYKAIMISIIVIIS